MAARWLVRSVAVALLAAPLGAAAQRIVEIPVGGSPYGAAVDPDGALYFTNGASLSIVKNSAVSAKPVGTSGVDSLKRTARSGVGIWMTDPAANKYWELTFFSIGAHSIDIPTPNAQPSAIAVDGVANLWVTEFLANKVLYNDGAQHEFPLPHASSQPSGIAVSPYTVGAWLVESAGNRLAHVDESGTFNEYVLPSAGAFPDSIAASRTVLAFTEPGVNKVALFPIDTISPILEYDLPTPNASPGDIIWDGNGHFWFSERLGNKIGSIDLKGVIAEYPIPTPGSLPRGLVSSPDGDIWFAESAVGKVGHLRTHVPGDANGDGSVDVTDVFLLINYLFAGGPAPH